MSTANYNELINKLVSCGYQAAVHCAYILGEQFRVNGSLYFLQLATSQADFLVYKLVTPSEGFLEEVAKSFL